MDASCATLGRRHHMHKIKIDMIRLLQRPHNLSGDVCSTKLLNSFISCRRFVLVTRESYLGKFSAFANKTRCDSCHPNSLRYAQRREV